jgi:1,4-dihydroxy-2-naphthoyl-CoA hydrolase
MRPSQAFSREDLKQMSPPLYEELRTIRFQDVDVAGIVFFARVQEYFHDALMACLDRAGIDVRQMLKKKCGIPLIHAEADYLAPMRFGDSVSVEVVGMRFGETSITTGFRVRDTSRARKPMALGQTVQVFMNMTTFSTQPVPSEFIHAIQGIGRPPEP